VRDNSSILHNKSSEIQLSWWSKFKGSRFTRAARNNPLSVISIFFVIAFFILAFFPGSFTEHDPEKINLRARLQPPSSEHLMGTDRVGMDVFSRVVYGARTTLKIVAIVLVIAVGIGMVIGSLSGFLGGYMDTLLMRLSDIFLAFPSLILAISLNAALGRGLFQSILAVGWSWWPGYSRMVRGQILSVKNEEYVTAAHCIGASKSRILIKHVLLNSFDPIIVKITLDIGYIALTTAGLSFLGLGAEPPLPEWGRMVAEGRDNLLDQWWISTFPGLALFILVVSFNLFGELIRDWLDPSAIGRE
jgi:peptide/nickel transport system permease protein